MSWTDKKSIEAIKKIRDIYGIKTLIETGTFMGVNAELHSYYFDEVLTCENLHEYFKKAEERLSDNNKVQLVNMRSDKFLRKCRLMGDKPVIYYLDAHFYNPQAPREDKWAILKELKELKNLKKACIVIHDFAINGLGHCCYNGECLDWKLIGKDLMKVNPNFRLYVNSPELCDIITEADFKGLPLKRDFETLDNVRRANSSERLNKRGMIYALPTREEIGMHEFKP